RARLEERGGDFERSVACALRALGRFESLADDEACARLGAYAPGVTMLTPGRGAQADDLMREALRVSERDTAAPARWAVLYDAALVAYERHEHRRAVELS